MSREQTRNLNRQFRQRRIRRKVTGTPERPRLHVFKSHKNFYLQIIDDHSGRTLVAAGTLEAEVKGKLAARGNLTAAKTMGNMVAQRLLAKGIKQVVFDRGGFKYHGAVKALAEAARESGLEF